MSWSHWIYLAIGLGLGLGSRWLVDRLKEKSRGKQSVLTGVVEAGLIDQPEAQQIVQLNSSVGLNGASIPQADRQDMSALLQDLKQAKIAYQLAQHMSQFKAGFLARTAHELRSPLNSLIGLHQLILSDLCDDPAEERTFVAQANQSALKLMHLMDRILEVSRLEHGTIGLEIQPLQLAEILAEVYNSTYLLAANRNLRLQLSPPTAEIYVLADPRWLQQALLNLLDTCFTQMEEGSISISTQLPSACDSVLIWLDVQLPVHKWSEPVNIFQSEQLSQESILKTHAPLTPGMTLLLTQTILELMHCRLEINSVPTDTEADSFTRMQLTIPLVTPEPETASLESEGN